MGAKYVHLKINVSVCPQKIGCQFFVGTSCTLTLCQPRKWFNYNLPIQKKNNLLRDETISNDILDIFYK